MNAFLAGVEGSGWLRHVKSVLETSAFIAKAVSDGISVVVHCSDGWDRTAQTCGLKISFKLNFFLFQKLFYKNQFWFYLRFNENYVF
jgi:protein-tyrosine phosphatase